MKKIFALIVAATMGLSSAAFAADTTTAPAAGTTTTQTAPAKTVHHVKNTRKPRKPHRHKLLRRLRNPLRSIKKLQPPKLPRPRRNT